jgi:hypothetical protein
MKAYETVIGLEVHVELATKSKIFCGCTTQFGGDPNTHCCPVCTGMPGTLPVLNKKVVEFAMAAGLATNCTITQKCKFDRKNYFYPIFRRLIRSRSSIFRSVGTVGLRSRLRQERRSSEFMRFIWRRMPVSWYMIPGRIVP